MSEQEYFIRNPDSENARGPFTIDKLQSLVDAEQLDRKTLYYDDSVERWFPIGDNSDMCDLLFPQKTKLTLRKGMQRAEDAPPPPPPKEEPAAPGPKMPPIPTQEVEISAEVEEDDDDEDEPSRIDVQDILAAAEGDTDEMSRLRSAKKWRGRAAAISTTMMAVIMLVSAVTLLIDSWDMIYQLVLKGKDADWSKLLDAPIAILGLIDAFLALMLYLAVTEIYPLLRFRVMVGFGFFGYLAFSSYLAGNAIALYTIGGLGIFALGLYTATPTLSFPILVLCGLGSTGGLIVFGLTRYAPQWLQ